MSRQKALQSGRFIVLNNSAIPKIAIKITIFKKILELIECRRGDPYMTA